MIEHTGDIKDPVYTELTFNGGWKLLSDIKYGISVLIVIELMRLVVDVAIGLMGHYEEVMQL